MSVPTNEVVSPTGSFPTKEFRTLVSVLTYSKAPQVRLEALHHFLECWIPGSIWHIWMREDQESWTVGHQPNNEQFSTQPIYSQNISVQSKHVHLQGWINHSNGYSSNVDEINLSEQVPFSQFLLHLLLNYPNDLSDEKAGPRMQELETSRLELFSETVNTLSERLNSGIRIWKELPEMLYISAAFLNAQKGFIALNVDGTVGFESFGLSENEKNQIRECIGYSECVDLPEFWKQDGIASFETLEVDGNFLGWIGFAGKDKFRNEGQSKFSPLDKRMIQTLANSLKIALGKLTYLLKQENVIEQHRVMLNTVNTGIITTDHDLNITQVNRKCSEILGHPIQKLINTNLLDWIPSNAPLAEFIKQAVQQQSKEAAESISISARDDRMLNIYYSPLNYQKEGNRDWGHLFSLEDVTELHKLRDSFSTYVSDRVLKMVQQQEHRVRLGGERKQCVVLFCDIRGFTKWSDNSDAEKVVETLNQYFTLMMEAVIDHNGEIDKIIGDELMAVYYTGPDESLSDSVEAAMKSAHQMQRALKLLNALRSEQGNPPVQFGVGINAGEVICGNIGSFKRMDYTVIGDTVNVASRLCASAKSNQILVSESYRELLDESAQQLAIDLGTIEVKGKEQPLSIFELRVEEQE